MADQNIIASAQPLEHTETEHGHKVPSHPDEINPKLASDIHYWTKELNVTGQVLHEAIRVHGTHLVKIRKALEHGDVSLSNTNG